MIDDGTQLGHLHQGGLGHASHIHTFPDRCQLGVGGIVVVLHPLDAAEHLGKVQGLYRDTLRFENLLAVTHRGRLSGALQSLPRASCGSH
jgi:hypothetical protein